MDRGSQPIGRVIYPFTYRNDCGSLPVVCLIWSILAGRLLHVLTTVRGTLSPCGSDAWLVCLSGHFGLRGSRGRTRSGGSEFEYTAKCDVLHFLMCCRRRILASGALGCGGNTHTRRSQCACCGGLRRNRDCASSGCPTASCSARAMPLGGVSPRVTIRRC